METLVLPWAKQAGPALRPPSAGAVNQAQALGWAERFLFMLVQSRALRVSPEPGKAPGPPTHQETAQGNSLHIFQLHPLSSDGCLGAAQVWTFIALCHLLQSTLLEELARLRDSGKAGREFHSGGSQLRARRELKC